MVQGLRFRQARSYKFPAAEALSGLGLEAASVGCRVRETGCVGMRVRSSERDCRRW